MNKPLIVGIAGSHFSRDWYAKHLGVDSASVKLVPEILADRHGGFAINLAKPGSCNRRIVRRGVTEALMQRRINPQQPIVLVMELAFDVRYEVWLDQHPPQDANESNFYSMQFSNSKSWWQQLRDRGCLNISFNVSDTPDLDSDDLEYLERLNQGRAWFHSAEAESINLYFDIITATALLRTHGIDYVIFSAMPRSHNNLNHVRDFLLQELSQDPAVLDFHAMSFTGWCQANGFPPIDDVSDPLLGHPSLEAHCAFADMLGHRIGSFAHG